MKTKSHSKPIDYIKDMPLSWYNIVQDTDMCKITRTRKTLKEFLFGKGWSRYKTTTDYSGVIISGRKLTCHPETHKLILKHIKQHDAALAYINNF